MKTMNIVVIVLVVLALFVTGYIFIKKSLPSNTTSESSKASFPVSKDVPKPKAKPSPTYDLPSATLPYSEPTPVAPQDEIPAEQKETPPTEPPPSI